MRKNILALLATLLLLVAVCCSLLLYSSWLSKPSPVAVNGAIDLSTWDFEEGGVIKLDGEWEFYPNELLSQEDIASRAQPGPQPEIIQVPGSWSQAMDIRGSGTYRLRVWIGDPSPVFGMKTGSILLSHRLLVNGAEVVRSGQPGGQESYRALMKPGVGFSPMRAGWNEIIVHVANYDFPADSGIVESIYFGTAEQIIRLNDRAKAYDWVTITAFLIIGLYFAGLYAQRKKDRSSLVFGLMCLGGALFTSVRGERMLLHVFDDLSFWLYIQIQVLSAVGVGIGFALYVQTTFRAYCSMWIVRSGLVIGSLLVLLYLLFAPEINTHPFRIATTFYIAFYQGYAIYIFVKAALHKVDGSAYLVFAAVAVNITALKQNMNLYFGQPIYTTIPFEPFLFLLMLALLMSLRFSNAFHRIEELSEQLLTTDKLKDEFLARTSHEFKTPLHGVMSLSRSMLDDASTPPTTEQRDKLQLIVGMMGRLSQLVYDILDLSSLKQGQLRVEPMPIDVRAAVELQVRTYTYISQERNIQLINDVTAALPPALADENRLAQIISNLLDNAIKHTDHGRVTITAAVRGRFVEIALRDTGAGIASDKIPYVFEPFQAWEDGQRGGYGLGLPIAKQLAELQNGTLTVESSIGEGSTFTLTLPRAEKALMKSSEAARLALTDAPKPSLQSKAADFSFGTPYESQPNGKHTVLIVDDQFVNLKVLLDILQTLDYRVIAVKDGYEAIAQLDRPGKIDLVILDLMMPGMSGYEVCQEIRKRYSLLELPILMVTANINHQDRLTALQAGANDYLLKPFDHEELKARIGGLLALQASLAKAVHLEVAFLQSQIKPHFLYNVLNSIVASSYRDVERARSMIIDLADYLRGSFRFSNTDERIPFAEEYKLIQTYINIERARFRGRIRFAADIADGAHDVLMPPLLLQPLVENAIRHGIGDRVEGGTVTLTASRSGADWLFIVSDDGVGMEPEQRQGLLEAREAGDVRGVGLLNINQRLHYEYGTPLQIESEPGRGTTIAVRVRDSVRT